MSDIKRIIVTIEGGVVTAVIAETEGKAQPRLPVTIIDYDTEGADEWDLTFIYQTDGTVPGFPEAVSFESCNHIEGLFGCIVVGFGLCGRDVPDGAEQAVIVEPIDPT